MENFKIQTRDNLNIIALESRDFEMSVTNGTITLDPGSDRIIYNVSYGQDINPFVPSDNGDTYSFEVLHQAKDPDFTKWDNRLFMEAIEFFGHAVLGIGEFYISSLDAAAFNPYEDFDGLVVKSETVDDKELPY